jgi:hypothetical protein
MPGPIIWPSRTLSPAAAPRLRPVHYLSDVCTIAASFGFVQCNMIMDDMHSLHVEKISLTCHLTAKSAMGFFMFR